MEYKKKTGRIYKCIRCKLHGKDVMMKSHSRICPYLDCKCPKCMSFLECRSMINTKRTADRPSLSPTTNGSGQERLIQTLDSQPLPRFLAPMESSGKSTYLTSLLNKGSKLGQERLSGQTGFGGLGQVTPGKLSNQVDSGRSGQLTPGKLSNQTVSRVPDQLTSGKLSNQTDPRQSNQTISRVPGLLTPQKPSPMLLGISNQSTPGLSSQMVSGTTSQMISGTTNRLTPGTTTQMVFETTNQLTPGLSNQLTSGTTNQLTPGLSNQLTPGLSNQIVSETTNQLTPGLSNQMVSGTTTQSTPGLSNQMVSGTTNQLVHPNLDPIQRNLIVKDQERSLNFISNLNLPLGQSSSNFLDHSIGDPINLPLGQNSTLNFLDHSIGNPINLPLGQNSTLNFLDQNQQSDQSPKKTFTLINGPMVHQIFGTIPLIDFDQPIGGTFQLLSNSSPLDSNQFDQSVSNSQSPCPSISSTLIDANFSNDQLKQMLLWQSRMIIDLLSN